jgi:hypothetical protein
MRCLCSVLTSLVEATNTEQSAKLTYIVSINAPELIKNSHKLDDIGSRVAHTLYGDSAHPDLDTILTRLYRDRTRAPA